MSAGRADDENLRDVQYPHADNATYPKGADWMQGELSFGKLKLTNNSEEQRRSSNAVILRSMHKYVPVLMVHRYDPVSKGFTPFVEKEFTIANFIAVTAYQNTDVTNIKISANPFAKGFREGGRKRGHDNSCMAVPSKQTANSFSTMMNPANFNYHNFNNSFIYPMTSFNFSNLPWSQQYNLNTNMNAFQNKMPQFPFMFPPSI